MDDLPFDPSAHDSLEMTRHFLQGPFWGVVLRPLLCEERDSCLRRLRDRSQKRQDVESDDVLWGRIQALEEIERELVGRVRAHDYMQAEQADEDREADARTAQLVAGGRYAPH